MCTHLTAGALEPTHVLYNAHHFQFHLTTKVYLFSDGGQSHFLVSSVEEEMSAPSENDEPGTNRIAPNFTAYLKG